MVPYSDLYDAVGYATEVYVVVTDIKNLDDPCADVPELAWENGIKLSQLVEGQMYKLDLSSVQAAQAAFSVKAENDLGYKARVSAVAYSYCEETDEYLVGEATKQLAAAYVAETMVPYSDLYDAVGYATEVYVVVTNIENLDKKEYAYKTIEEYICDGETYVDPITNEAHVISSLVPASQSWTTTKTINDQLDSVYTFVITPIVAPEAMTVELMATIPGATPALVAGEEVDVTGTIEAILAYYQNNDTEAIADVLTVTWTSGTGVVLDCEETTHTMTLLVEAGCDFVVPATLTFDVTPVDVETTSISETICEGESYTWAENNVTYTEGGTYTVTLTNEAGCVVKEATLVLTVNPVSTEEFTETACESYEWHGTTYTESGDYTFEEDCRTEILHLTITGPSISDVVENVTVCSGDTYSWNGATYDAAGTYTVTLTNAAGCDSIATLQIYIADADNDPTYDNLDAVGKYGDRLLLLNLNRLNELAAEGTIPAVPAANDVTWYRVVGDRDKIADILNGTSADPDEEMPNSNSYYYNNPDGAPLQAGLYYALLEIPGEPCNIYMRTEVVELGESASLAPQLMPTIARPEHTLRLVNLNPNAVSEIRVYNTTGELLESYTSTQATEFMMKAANLQGYYMVEVQTEADKVTLRYIVK